MPRKKKGKDDLPDTFSSILGKKNKQSKEEEKFDITKPQAEIQTEGQQNSSSKRNEIFKKYLRKVMEIRLKDQGVQELYPIYEDPIGEEAVDYFNKIEREIMEKLLLISKKINVLSYSKNDLRKLMIRDVIEPMVKKGYSKEDVLEIFAIVEKITETDWTEFEEHFLDRID